MQPTASTSRGNQLWLIADPHSRSRARTRRTPPTLVADALRRTDVAAWATGRYEADTPLLRADDSHRYGMPIDSARARVVPRVYVSSIFRMDLDLMGYFAAHRLDQARAEWREAARTARMRWTAFLDSERETRQLAFASYVAALDGEEAAAAEIAGLLSRDSSRAASA